METKQGKIGATARDTFRKAGDSQVYKFLNCQGDGLDSFGSKGTLINFEEQRSLVWYD